MLLPRFSYKEVVASEVGCHLGVGHLSCLYKGLSLLFNTQAAGD